MRGLGRLVQAVGATVVVLGVLGVLPTALILVQTAVVWDWRATLAGPPSAVGVFAVLIGVGWGVWLALVVAVVLDAVAAVRGLRGVMWLPVSLHAAITTTVG